MSTLSDVQALYGTMQDTWAKSQAHVIAHFVLAGVVFGICGATVPEVAVAPIDPKQVSDNEWFKLAKDTGVVYVLFVVPIVLLAAYAALLRAGGQLFVTIMMLMFRPPLRRSQYRLRTSWALEPVALTVEKKDFNLSDLQNKSSELALKYQSKKNEQWGPFQESISKLTKNAQVYLGDFLLFLFLWIALFDLLPQTEWIEANESRYWPVVVVLSVLAWFAWFRVSRAIAIVPSLLLMYVSMMIRGDPDMKAILDVSEQKREDVRQKLEELLRKEEELAQSRPSLIEFLKYKTGLGRRPSERESARKDSGWPFHLLYEAGLRFYLERERHTQYEEQWFAGYLAYLYYRLHARVSSLAKAVWQLSRYIITGAP